MPANLSLGRHDQNNFPLPTIALYKTPLRAALTIDDTTPSGVPTNERIDLTQSRYGTGNIVIIDVVAASAGVVVSLYKLVGTDYIFISSQTTTAAKQELKFYDVPAFVIVPFVTSVINPTKLNGGGTN